MVNYIYIYIYIGYHMCNRIISYVQLYILFISTHINIKVYIYICTYIYIYIQLRSTQPNQFRYDELSTKNRKKKKKRRVNPDGVMATGRDQEKGGMSQRGWHWFQGIAMEKRCYRKMLQLSIGKTQAWPTTTRTSAVLHDRADTMLHRYVNI